MESASKVHRGKESVGFRQSERQWMLLALIHEAFVSLTVSGRHHAALQRFADIFQVVLLKKYLYSVSRGGGGHIRVFLIARVNLCQLYPLCWNLLHQIFVFECLGELQCVAGP